MAQEPDTPEQSVALFDGRAFFEKALQHGVRHGILAADKLAAIAAEAEAAETDQTDRPIPAHVTVGRPNRARSRVLQVRLNPDEFEAIERIAADRGLPPSTVARERLLAMIREDQGPEADVATVLVDVADQLRAVATRMNPNAVGA
jgi:hypothetical protein